MFRNLRIITLSFRRERYTSLLKRKFFNIKRVHTKKINIIAAVDNCNGIGYQNSLQWRIPPDLKRFSRLTQNSNIIMGRKTYESLKMPSGLPKRNNIILTRNSQKIKSNSLIKIDNIEDALKVAEHTPCRSNEIWIIGGSDIYEQIYSRGLYNEIYLTKIYKTFKSDSFFPVINLNHHQLIEESKIMIYDNIPYQYLTYKKISNPEEMEYIHLLQKVMNAPLRKTRNGYTRSVFQPPRLEFDLRNGFPALTTKRIWVKGVLRELQWFLSGSVDAKDLSKKGCNIWNSNSSREFLDSKGLFDFEEGEIGETYGFLFRHYGASYKGINYNYENKGFDQIQGVIDKIHRSPTDRRLIINLFKPDALDNCALPPCMCWYQFYVEDGYLDLYVYIRSSDIVLGLPWNIVTGALLSELIARITGLKSRRLIINLGDVHIYDEHVSIFKEQVSRIPSNFPKLEINEEIKTLDNIINLDPNKVIIRDYNPYPTIKADMIA